MDSDLSLKVKYRLLPAWLDMVDKGKRRVQDDFTAFGVSNQKCRYAFTDMGKLGGSWFGTKSKGEL